MIGRFSALVASTTLVDPVFSFLVPRTLNFTSSPSRHAPATILKPQLPPLCRNTRRSQSSKLKTRTSRLHSSSFSAEVALESIADSLKTGQIHRVLVVAGAGVSCSAGIPDFRTPGSGLYDNLHKFNLPYPEAIFDVDFYIQDPKPFVTLAKEIWPGVKYRPTLTHCFFKLLEEKGLLKRVYTQNIDGLEAVAGVNPDKLVECHGHFRSASCIACRTRYDANLCKTSMLEKGEAPSCNNCGGLIKPDIVFFGEVMPNRFSQLVHDDVASTDLIIVMGTSLLVAPVANVPDWVPNSCPRLLINREIVGSFRHNKSDDVILEGDCDEGVRKLCRLAGWEAELDQMFSDSHTSATNQI
eukprot:CCRYP_000090-RA/>CCRYP_000090-RA protein AED:0.05 eAED:0.05 QI:192/1/1/1/1/1/4/798/354